MPEGHTLHRLAATLDSAFAGTTPDVSSPQGRFVEGAHLLNGRQLERAEAWGKHLFVTFAGDAILNVHLGLIGVFDVTPYSGGRDNVPPAVGAVRVRLVNDSFVADLRGATVVEVVTPDKMDATISRLGADPLRSVDEHNDPNAAWARVRRSNRPIAELLMDQSILAGVGNVYRCEVLFRHRVDPFCPGSKLKPATWATLWADLVDLLPVGVAFGQIITMDEQLEPARALISTGEHRSLVWRGSAEGEAGRGPRPAYESASPFPRSYAVYKRTGEPCLVCGSRIRTKVLASRNLFWCGRCQRRH